MLYRWLADTVVAAHCGFVVFVVLGGLLALRWPRIAWIHLPAAAWGVLIEYAGFVCPLTPLEIALRQRGGIRGYAGDFIEHYLTPALYPSGLTRATQVALGTFALLLNVVVYWNVLKRHHASGRRHLNPSR